MIKTESYKKGIIASVVLNAAAKGAYFVNLLSINYFIGANISTDIYFFCTTLVTLAAGFALYIITDVISPEVVRRREDNGQSVFSFVNSFFLILFGISSFFALLLVLFPFSTISGLSKFSPAVISEYRVLISLFGLLFVLMIITSLLTNVLAAYRYFTIPMLANLINNLLAIFFIIFFGNKIGVMAAVAGLLAGYLLNVAFLIFLLKQKLKWKFIFGKIEIPRKVYENMIWVGCAYALYFIYMNFSNYFISGFGEGEVTAVNFGQQVAQAPYQLIAAQVLSVAAIKLYDVFANNNNIAGIRTAYYKSLKVLMLILIPAAACCWFFSDVIMNLIFLYSQKINNIYIAKCSEVFSIFALTVPFTAIHVLNTKVLIAKQKIRKMFGIHTVIYLCFLLFIYYGSTNYGLKGYLSASLLASIVSVLIYLPIMKKELYVLEQPR